MLRYVLFLSRALSSLFVASCVLLCERYSSSLFVVPTTSSFMLLLSVASSYFFTIPLLTPKVPFFFSVLCCYFSWNLHFVGVAYRQSVFLISPHTVKLCVCIGMSNVNMNVDTACVVCIPFWILSAHTFLYPSPALVRHKKFNRPTMCVCILRYEIDGCKTRACDSPNGGNSLHRHR